MEGSDSSRSRSKREVEDILDARSSWKEDDEERDVDSRKNRSGKSRKHGYADEDEEQDDGRRKSSGDRNELRKKSVTSSSRACSGGEDDYDVRREPRLPKVPRRSPDDRSEMRSSDGYKDRDVDSSRRRREDESDWDSSRRSCSRTSGYEISQSKNRNKVEGPYDGERERLQEGIKSSEGRESSRERQGYRDQEEKGSQRRVDEAYVSRRADEIYGSDRADISDDMSYSEHSKHRNTREISHDFRNESGESKSKGVDSTNSRFGKSDSKEERWEDSERRKGVARMEKGDLDNRSVDPSCETGSLVARDDKHGKVQERPGSSVDDIGQITLRYSTKPEEKDEALRHQMVSKHERNDDLDTKDNMSNLDGDVRALSRDGSSREARHGKQSRTPERLGRYQRESDEFDRGHSDSDNERSISMKDKIREDVHGDYKSYRGKDRNWNDKNRELEGSKDYWRNRQRQDSKETEELDPVTEWRHGQERLDGGGFHGRSGYRKDSRGRFENNKGLSAYGNRYDSSDSIEIRPNRNLDFGRDGSVSGRRSDTGSHQDLVLGTNDDKWVNPSEDRAKRNYGYGEDMQDRYYDDAQNMDQNSGRSSIDSQSGRGGLKGAMTTNNSVVSQSGSSSMISPVPQQGPKGSRLSRGGRGRPNGRDSQRIGVPMPIMPPPPFGHLGLPPGPMQPIAPNMSHSPGPPLGPGVFMPPFPGPLVWPGARGVDVNMLAVPPNLPIPPVAAGPRFNPSLGAGPSHNIHLNQTGTGRGASTNVSGSGFNPMGTPSREMPHDKPPSGWAPQRNSGPTGKAPSRGEQNDYSQNFVDTGMRPQNFIRELELTSVVEDYPKLRELIQRKDEIVAKSASPPMYYKCDLKEQMLSPEFFGTKFDVILVDPPWEEYVHRAPGITDHIEYWTPDEIMNLKIEAIADTPSFIFLWVGDGVGLEQGRQCLKKWGFRRCEDICWVKTNKKNATPGLRHDSNTLFQHSKEHCLMGIKGTVRRSTDGHIIHANIDTDIIIAEEPTDGLTKKPEDMYRIVEHFALGRRRLELFGEDHNIRPGWLTLGRGLSSSNFNKEAYTKNFVDRDGKVWQGGGGRNPPPDTPHLVVTTPEIESLRPKSPPQKNQQQQLMPPMGSSSSANRRPAGNSPQSSVAVVGSEAAAMPAPWASSPMAGFGMPEGGPCPDSNLFDSYGFNAAPYGRPSGDHMDFESHRMNNLL